MRSEGTRYAREGRRAVLAVLASVLLASCSTSDTGSFGFAAIAPTSLDGQTTDFSQPTVNSAVSPADEGDVIAQFIIEEGDPTLPTDVASAPSQRPLSDDQPAATQQQAQIAATPQPETMSTQTPVETAQAEAVVEQAAADPVAPQLEATQFLENAAPAQEAATPAPTKRGFLSAFFGTSPAATRTQPARPLIASAPQASAEPAQPIVQLASTGTAAKPLVARAARGGEASLPGVRADKLFEITRRSGVDDDSDIDIYEGRDSYEVASAAGMARLAPNGLLRQTENVDVACLKPSLVRVLKSVERHYGRKVIVTSGYRNPDRNRRARGARNSLHMYCAAADIQIEGVTKTELAQFVRSMPGRGGVGTYCHTESVHIDVGPERDWNWRCRRRK